jgi:hypothetical protein
MGEGRMMRPLAVLLVLLSWGAVAGADNAVDYFRAQTDRATVNLGDQVLYTVEVMIANTQQSTPDITLPELSSLFQVQDTVTRSSINILNGRTYTVYFKEVSLIANHTGNLTIAPAKVQWRDAQKNQVETRSTNAALIRINEASGAAALPTPTPDIGVLRPNKSMAHISLNQWLPLAAGGAACIALIWGVQYVRHRPEKVVAPPPEPVDPRTPEQRALDALAEVARLKQEGKVNELYTALSMILRRYLEEEFNFKAQEMTTRELLEEMARLDFKPEFLERYRGYFSESDSVKFANLTPGQEKVADVDLRTRQIILDPDKRVFRPPQPEPSPDQPVEGESSPTEETPAAPPSAGGGSQSLKA